MGELTSVPWLMTAFAAAAFALLAFRAGRTWYVWALGWAIYALVLCTWITGLFQAAYLPVLESESALKFKAIFINSLLIVIPAALCAWRLKPQPRLPQRVPTVKP